LEISRKGRSTSDLEIFGTVVTAALIRAEHAGRVAARFTGAGPQLWAAFRNELTLTDLLDLAVRDAAVLMPQAFDLGRLWPETSDADLHVLSPDHVSRYIERGKEMVAQPSDTYLRAQANALGVMLPSPEGLSSLPVPEAHHHILELPGSGGYLAYELASRPNAAVYYWENFTIACGTWQEQLMASLIAFEVGAPPRRELLVLHDPTLGKILGETTVFDWIIGLREANMRHADALRSFLKPGGRVLML